MWIISKTGFVSLVQHNTDDTLLRARARRSEHLTDTFPECEVIDLGINCPDYRWHTDIARQDAIDHVIASLESIDYPSHVKEEVTGGTGKDADHVFYRAMLDCWTALARLQDRPPRDPDFWSRYDDWEDRRTYPDFDDDREPESITDLSDTIAGRMAASRFADDDPATWDQERWDNLTVDEALDVADDIREGNDPTMYDDMENTILTLAAEIHRLRAEATK
jgi:hypothetical protein